MDMIIGASHEDEDKPATLKHRVFDDLDTMFQSLIQGLRDGPDQSDDAAELLDQMRRRRGLIHCWYEEILYADESHNNYDRNPSTSLQYLYEAVYGCCNLTSIDPPSCTAAILEITEDYFERLKGNDEEDGIMINPDPEMRPLLQSLDITLGSIGTTIGNLKSGGSSLGASLQSSATLDAACELLYSISAGVAWQRHYRSSGPHDLDKKLQTKQAICKRICRSVASLVDDLDTALPVATVPETTASGNSAA